MKIKKFRGANALEVLNEVKKELGEEALILSSRRVEVDGELLYEITAAIDEKVERVPVRKPKTDKEPLDLLKEELSEIKSMLQEIFAEKLRDTKYLRWLEAGLPSQMAKEMEDPLSWLKVRLKSLKETPISKFIIFVGPPGSGKTTNLFKIAAWLKYRQGMNLGVVSLDVKRVGAGMQALRLGELLEIPVLTASLEEVEKIRGFASRFEGVLFDTPSWGRFFHEEEVESLLKVWPRARIQAVVKGTESALEINRFLEELKSLPVEGLVLTHVDRVSLGLSLGFLVHNGSPPISFVSWGERVPEDLSRATPEILERIFMRGLEKIYDLK